MTHPGGPARRHPAVLALVVILFAECALLLAGMIWLIIELFIDTPDSFVTALALIVLAGIAAAWLAVVAVNVLRGAAWTRAGTIVWQVLQIAVAIGCFQGAFAQPLAGWLLLIPALIAGLLVLSKPVIEATSSDRAAS